MENIKKIFVEVIHSKNLVFANNMDIINKIIQSNIDEFPQTNMNIGANFIQLTNPDKKQMMMIDTNRFVIDFDQPRDTVRAIDIFIDKIQELGRYFGVESYQRIGLRVLNELNSESYDEANKIIKNKFIKFKDDEFDIFGRNPQNFHFGFTSEVDKYKVNHNINVAVNQEVNIDPQAHQFTATTSYGLRFDIDFFIDTPTESKNLKDFFTQGNDTILNFIGEYNKIIKGE